MQRRAIILFKFVFTTTYQSMGAPVVDRCNGKTQEGYYWKGYAVHLSPWRRNRFGDRKSGIAFCIGRLGKRGYYL